jgi:hypothetical protein
VSSFDPSTAVAQNAPSAQDVDCFLGLLLKNLVSLSAGSMLFIEQ